MKVVYSNIKSRGEREKLKDALTFFSQRTRTYFIQDGKYIKIGKTGNIEKRLIFLQVGNPRLLSIRLLIVGDQELLLHRLFAKYRGLGEWFTLPDEWPNKVKKFCKLYKLAYKFESEPIPMSIKMEMSFTFAIATAILEGHILLETEEERVIIRECFGKIDDFIRLYIKKRKDKSLPF